MVRDLAVPILRGERVVAIIGVGNKATDYTQDDVDVLQSLAVRVMDLVRYKWAEEALHRSETRHRLLSETMAQGVVYQDADGKIISMNPAAERILGKGPELFVGRTSVDEEHHTVREDGLPFPGLEHPSMVALRTGQCVRGVVMGVFNPRRERLPLDSY